MGSTGSRPRLHKVAPWNSLQEEEDQPKPQWTLPALPVSAEQPSTTMGQKKTTLPPLKQEITLSTLSGPCFVGEVPPKQSSYPSIIHSHPPRRAQALQPLAVQIGQPSSANHFAMRRGCRDGGVQQFSTTGQAGHSGTGRMTQGRFLEAQVALTQQDHRQRVHLRQARELRRRKVVYTVNGGDTEENQKRKLVRRPTERDIFWDETTGKSLDPKSLLQPEEDGQPSQRNIELLCKRGEGRQKIQARVEGTLQTEYRGLSVAKNLSWTTKKKTLRAEDGGEGLSDSWMWPEFMSNGQTDRKGAVRGKWDF